MENLHDRRTELGMTQVKVAKECGVSVYTYQLWERGVSNPSPKNEKKLKEVLKLKEEE